MGRGGPAYISYTAFVLLSSTVSADLWTVDIDESPAPSPEDGPPFSAGASRDRSLLPYQIIGIVGSYVCSVFVIFTLLLTVARKSRKRAQMMSMISAEKSREMVKPLGWTFDKSPASPESQRSWYSPRRSGKGKKSTASQSVKSLGSAVSPGMDSVVSFDTNVIEADRQKRAEEMERLYAAVMAQDDRKSQMAKASSPTNIPSIDPPEYSRRDPPRLTDAPSLRHLRAGMSSTQGPASPVRAIYPPDSPINWMPNSPTSPVRAEYTNAPLSPVYATDFQTRRERSSSSSSSNALAPLPSGKKARKSVRNLRISAPIMQRNDDDNTDGARTPLSPRFYTDPGIPPDPPTARTVDTMDSAMYQPTTPVTAHSFGFGNYGDERDEISYEVRDLPQAHPQRLQNSPPRAMPSAPPHIQTNFSQPLSSFSPQRQANNPPTNSANNSLPFRQHHWNTPASPLYPYQGQGPFSAGPIKTTFVESSRDRLAAGTPRTGMITPYSAYMPFTPLTPVTPRLTTRAERRQRDREARAIQGAITEEDQVADNGELWDEGY